MINSTFIIAPTMYAFLSKSLLSYFSSAESLLIDIGKLNCDIVIISMNVGVITEYSDITLIPAILVYTIFPIIPITLAIAPLTNNIIIFLIKTLFFIFIMIYIMNSILYVLLLCAYKNMIKKA